MTVRVRQSPGQAGHSGVVGERGGAATRATAMARLYCDVNMAEEAQIEALVVRSPSRSPMSQDQFIQSIQQMAECTASDRSWMRAVQRFRMAHGWQVCRPVRSTAALQSRMCPQGQLDCRRCRQLRWRQQSHCVLTWSHSPSGWSRRDAVICQWWLRLRWWIRWRHWACGEAEQRRMRQYPRRKKRHSSLS